MALNFGFAVTGASKVKNVLAGYLTGIQQIFAKDRLEKLIVKRTKARFGTPGSHKNAQRDPSGKPWVDLSPRTKRRYNRNRRQKLVDAKDLVQAIAVVRQNMTGSALQSPTGGDFSVGIAPSASQRVQRKARILNFGGYAGRNRKVRIPGRRYLGVGDEDVKAVDLMVKRVMRKFQIGVS